MDTGRLHRMARRLAYQYGRHECPEQLAQDLEQAAFLAELEGKNMKPRDAMLEELSRWLWQCKRGRGKDRLLIAKVELYEWSRRALGTMNPERILIIKEQLGREMWLEQQRRYARKREKKTGERTQEQRDYQRVYMRWKRGGCRPEDDPRFRKGRYKRARRLSLVTEGGARKPERLIEKYGVQVARKALRGVEPETCKISDPNFTKSNPAEGFLSGAPGMGFPARG